MIKISQAAWKVIYLIFVVAIVFFVFSYLSSNWLALAVFKFDFNPWLLPLSFFILALGIAALSLVWRKILLTLDRDATFGYLAAWRVYIYSEFGKYLPGKAWSIAGKIRLGLNDGLSFGHLAIAAALDGFLSLAAALFLGGCLALFYWHNLFFLSLIALFVVAVLIFFHPKIFYPLFNLFFIKIKKGHLAVDHYFSYADLLRFFVGYVLVYSIQGLAFIFFTAALFPISLANAAFVAGSFLISLGFGVLAIFAPSGLGVREGLLIFLLAGIIGTGGATMLSLFSRLWFTAAEVFNFFLVLAISFVKKIRN